MLNYVYIVRSIHFEFGIRGFLVAQKRLIPFWTRDVKWKRPRVENIEAETLR